MHEREKAAISRFVANEKSRYPEAVNYICSGFSTEGLLQVRRPHWPEGVVIKVPSLGVEPAEGARSTVRFHRASRQLPWAGKPGMGRERARAAGGIAPILLSIWQQAEGNPYLSRGASVNITAPNWNGDAATILAFPRYFYEAELHPGAPSLASRICHEGVVLTDDGRIAALGSLYSEDGGSVVGHLVREWDLNEGALLNEWILEAGPFGSTPTSNAQRRSGHLFFDKSSNTYTVATVDEVYCLSPGDSGETEQLYLEAGYGDMPRASSFGVAGAFAIQGAWQEFDAVSNSRSDCAVHVYGRLGPTGEHSNKWIHKLKVKIGDLLPSCDRIFSCGFWEPYSEVEDLPIVPNSRWPFLPATQEWLCWVEGDVQGDPYPERAESKLVAIKAATGAVRTIETLTAPVTILPYRDTLAAIQTYMEADAAYRSEHHPENWEPLGFPAFAADPGNGTYRGTGTILQGAGFQSTIPEEILPEDFDVLGICGQRVRRYQGWTTERDPAHAAHPVRLARPGICGAHPRGVVDPSNSQSYFVTTEAAWLLPTDELNVGPESDDMFVYAGNYEDFPQGSSPLFEAKDFRVVSIERNVEVGFAIPGDSVVSKTVLRHYSTTGLLNTLDLTRYFEESSSGQILHYYRAPEVYEYGLAGDYLFVLCADWWVKESSELTVIVINKISLLDLDRIKISPAAGRLVDLDEGLPQLLLGVDSTSPWAQVIARWAFSPPSSFTEWFVREVRYADSEASIATIKNEVFDTGGLPTIMSEVSNVALTEGQQYWIEAGTSLKVRVDA